MQGLRIPKPCLPHAALQHSSHSSEPRQEHLEQRISKPVPQVPPLGTWVLYFLRPWFDFSPKTKRAGSWVRPKLIPNWLLGSDLN